MAKRIRREITINGRKQWISAHSEQEYADKLLAMTAGAHKEPPKHLFGAYVQNWFDVFSKPHVEIATAQTYEKALRNHVLPVLGEMMLEEIKPADIQQMFNRMDGARETKIKTRNILNMIFEQALEEEIIAKNPLRSRSIHITGKPSKTTEPYTIDQMRFLVQRIDLLSNATDRRYLALQALHPLRLEEVLGLQWQDIDLKRGLLRVERAVTHPTRNEPHIKPPKTLASRRTLHLAPQIACYLTAGAPSHFVLGGEKPLTYTQTVKMYSRIQRETQFAEKISPRRFRTTVLTDLYDTTRDIKLAQMSAGHTTAAMTLKHYVRGRNEEKNTALPVANLYGLTNY